MPIRLPYETKAGHFSETETYLQLIEHLRLAQEAAAAIGHHSKANDDWTRGQGFLAVSEMLAKVCDTVTHLATSAKGGLKVQ